MNKNNLVMSFFLRGGVRRNDANPSVDSFIFLFFKSIFPVYI